MGTPFADAGDLQLRWPSLPADQVGTAEVLLGDASLWLSTWYPTIVDQTATDPTVAGRLKVVACAMAKRAMLAGAAGVSQESVSTGPYNHYVTYSNPGGNLFVTSAEDSFIRGYRPQAMTVSMAEPC
jgi:hypothetical protein